MRRALSVPLAALLGVVLAIAPVRADGPADWDPEKLTTPPLHPIEKIAPKRQTLANGIVVYLLEDHSLPVVRGTAYVKASPTWIPNDKVGLGGLTGQVMRSGGTEKHPGDWLDDRLAAIGASIETSYDGQELASASFRCLSDNSGEVLGLWSEVMREPAFPDDKIELQKVALRRAIASRNDEVIPILVRVAREAIYGKESVWARKPEYATVEAITRADCAWLHRKIFEPSRMVIAVYGDFQSADLLKKLATTLGAWKGARTPLPPQPPVPTDSKPRLVFAPKEDVTQSGIILGHVGFRADDPDYPAMDVYQTVLGSGWQSRLVNKVRTERGLAYSCGAQAGEGYQKPGIFLAYSLTKSESTMTALELVRDEVQRSIAEPLTDDEVRLAKTSVENAFVFNFAQPSEILFRAAYYEVIGYPQDFLQTYQHALQGVTNQAVSDAARRKVHPDRLVTVVVGKEKDFDKPLDSARLPVERVDLTIPPPPSKMPKGASSPEAIARGRQWLLEASKQAGGAAAWSAIKSIKVEQSSTVTMQGQSVPVTSSLAWEIPDRVLSLQELPFGKMRMGYDGKNGWTAFGEQVKDEPSIGEHLKEEWERSLFRLLGHPDDVTLAAADKPATIEGATYRMAYVTSEIVPDLTLYFTAGGTLARMQYTGDGPTGRATQTEIYSDWKPVGPIKYPYARKVLIDGQPYLEAQVKTVVLDAPMDEATFKKPGS